MFGGYEKRPQNISRAAILSVQKSASIFDAIIFAARAYQTAMASTLPDVAAAAIMNTMSQGTGQLWIELLYGTERARLLPRV